MDVCSATQERSCRHGKEKVNRYKQSVVCNENISDYPRENLIGSFGQWSADNTDHQVNTLDGKGTLHAMGIVISTTGQEKQSPLPPIPRQKTKKVSEVVKGQGIPIHTYLLPKESGLSKLVFKPRIFLKSPYVMPSDVDRATPLL